MNKRLHLGVWVALLLTVALLAVGCGVPSATDTPEPTAAPVEEAEPEAAPAAEGETTTTEFLSMGDIDRQLAQMGVEAQGPADKPWEQMLEPIEMIDASEFKKDPPWHVCFSNASVANTWRVVGWSVMQYEVEQHPDIGEFTFTDAQENPEKQIADIEDLLTKDCDILIISPATTEALTPAVERAAATGIPVIVFDRGVNTKDYTTFIHPIGGYAFGFEGAQWLADEMGGQGKVLAIRVLPGVDVLETRWEAAQSIFDQYPDIEVVGVEFGEGDPAKVKGIVLDYLERYGELDGIWTDFGGVSAGAYEGFVDYGAPVPPITGEDFNGWLKVWQENDLKSISPTYPTYQWRTPVIAATRILNGESVPQEWVLPQPSITQDNLDQYARQDLPDGHFAMCGCEAIPGFLEELWDVE
jgi:ribose transport system substrate-binding protein